MSNFMNDVNQYFHEAFPVVRLRPTVSKVRIYSGLIVFLWIITFVGGGGAVIILSFGVNAWFFLLLLPWAALLGLLMHFGIWYDRKHGI